MLHNNISLESLEELGREVEVAVRMEWSSEESLDTCLGMRDLTRRERLRLQRNARTRVEYVTSSQPPMELEII